jgi:drug/metabolite transporter (DMT)-like permease
MNPQVIGLFLLAILSGTGMGISQKFLAGYSPLLINAIAQWLASVVFMLLYMILKWQGMNISFHRGMLVLWVAFVGLNFWYSALYGYGVALAYVPIIVTGAMTVLLGIAGWLWFGEVITWRFIIGALMILAGMGVMVVK